MGIKTTWELGQALEAAQAHEPVGNRKQNSARTEAEGTC
jgi:hypothetical protein